MAIFDIFKKKKKEIKGKEVGKPMAVPMKPKKTSETAYRILKGPHITEKATDLTHIGQYVFDVYERANKSEVKRTIEDIYGVAVVSLKIIKIPPKKRRLGKIEGWRQGYKKAIVKLAPDQKIEVLPR